MSRQPLNLIALVMEDAPKSPRGARIAALLVMAETLVAQTDTEKGSWEWKGRSEVVEAIALLVAANGAATREESAQSIPPDGIISPSCKELKIREDEISPTIPWMAEEAPKTDDLTIVDRGRLFSAWSEKRRCLREG